MPQVLRCSVGLLSLFLSIFLQAGSAEAPNADTIVLNARIYTVNPKQPWAEALAIRGEKIIAVGNAQEVAAYRGTATR